LREVEAADDLGLSTVQMGAAFSAFAWAYALFEIPGGFLGDWMGPRRVLMRIVLWWSSFTALTAAAFSYPSLLAVRFLFGMGEAGAWPSSTFFTAAITFSWVGAFRPISRPFSTITPT